MKQIIFEGKKLDVVDETETQYVCPPANVNEGYQYITKELAEELYSKETIDRVNKRTAMKLVKHRWVPCAFHELTSGCTFRLYEEDGTVVHNTTGGNEFIASGKPYVDDYGMNTIKVFR